MSQSQMALRAPQQPITPPFFPSTRRRVADVLADLGQRAPTDREASVDARLVLTPDGRPIRSIRTGRRVIVTGSYSSKKAGRALPWESRYECFFFHHCEVDVDVVDYCAQPLRIEFSDGGAKRIYIADCARLLADGAFEIVEIKSDRKYAKDPHYARKLEGVARICATLGWRFKMVFQDELVNPPARWANIRLIQSKRTVSFNAVDVYAALQVVHDEGGTATFGS